MSIKLITDSSCDLNKDLLERYNIGVVSLNVSIGEDYYKDTEMDLKDFYNKMKASKELPKTSCPSPAIFMSLYNCEEDNVIVLTATSKLTAIYSTAILGKTLFEEENNKRVEIIDTKNGSVGHGLILIKTAQLIEEGKLSFEEILVEIEKMKEEVELYGTLDTLENAVKGGRMSPLKGKITNALNLKVLVHAEDGLVIPLKAVRGENNGLKKVVENILNVAKDRDNLILNIGHANCPERAEKVKNMLVKEYNFKDIIISEVGPAMGTYTAEGAILVSIL